MVSRRENRSLAVGWSWSRALSLSGGTIRITLQCVKKHEVVTMRFQEYVEDQVFSPTLVAARLRTTKSEIAGTLGLGKDAFTRASRVRARKTQVRLRQMLEILNRVEAATGSPLAAYAWFRAEPLPGFGGATPDLLVREGRADQVHAYLDRVLAGGYA